MNERGPGRPRGSSHDKIRDIALGLFLEHGYSKTSLAQIAAAAGISRTTLFAYFAAKRDLIWEDFDDRVVDIDDVFASHVAGGLVDTIVEAMLLNSRYSAAEHDSFAQRVRIIAQDEELQAYTTLVTRGLADRLAELARERYPDADSGLIDMVTRALVAAAAHCTDEWVEAAPSASLDVYTAERLRPIVTALRPLLP